MIRASSQHPGYVFLITVLVTGMIASTSALSLLLLAWAAEQNGYLFWESAQAFEYAQTCAERSLLTLRSDLSYAGKETFTYEQGTCEILATEGAGNNNRVLCVEGTVGQAVRRIEITVSQVRPTTLISAWDEVSSFAKCQ